MDYPSETSLYTVAPSPTDIPSPIFSAVHRLSETDNPSPTLRAEATFSLCELACEKQPLTTTVQFSIVHARNLSRDSQAKLIVRAVVKWCEFRGNKKKCVSSDLLRKTHARLTQCLKPVKNRKNPVFLIYSSRFLDGFERLSAEATFLTPAHTAKMQPLLARYTSPNCPSKLTDKVRWIIHSKLVPLHYQIKTYYLSGANY